MGPSKRKCIYFKCIYYSLSLDGRSMKVLTFIQSIATYTFLFSNETFGAEISLGDKRR